jgi:RNA polymerase sigma-70 factor (ECF subfamily)
MSSFSLREQLGLLSGTGRTVTLQEQVTRAFEEARDDVYRYLVLLGLQPAQAQEAAQEVFLRLYIALRKGDEIRNHRAWIFRVAHNLGLKLRARQSNQLPYDPELELRLSDPAANPEQTLVDKERRWRLHKAIQGLSEQQRRCLYLRMEGLRYPEIGAALGISASTVGEFLRRAMARLRKVCDE